MSRNLRYAVRSLSKDRGFAAMVALSLAVGIGANTAIFSLVNGVLLRPLDYREPERLVAISQASPQFLKLYPALPINIATWLEWRRQSSPFESVGAYRNTALSLTGSGQPELIEGAAVSANFFHVLGVAPRLGREFLDSEDRSGQDQVVIIADSLWRRRFRADPGIVGRKIMLDAKPFLVIAVLPPDFQFPKQEDDIGTHSNGRMEIYRTLGYEPDDTVLHGGDLNYWPVARLRPGISITRASAELNSEEAAIDAKTDADFRATIVPLQDKLTGNIRQSLIVLMGAVGAVLLVLCVNLANLSLARFGHPHGARRQPRTIAASIADGERRTERNWRRGRNIAGVLGSAVAAGGRADRPSASGRRSPGQPRAVVRAGNFAGDGADFRDSSGAAQRGFAQSL